MQRHLMLTQQSQNYRLHKLRTMDLPARAIVKSYVYLSTVNNANARQT